MLLTSPWQPRLSDAAHSPCERLVEALAADIVDGALPAGARLPPHRDVAWKLGVGLGTVTKAYGLLQRRGLIQSSHGRGSFVAGHARRQDAAVDLSMNIPPRGLSDRLLAASLRDLARRLDAETFGTYALPEGRADHRALLARWLSGHNVEARPEHLLICHGAQHALAIALATTCRAGTVLLTEAVTYPGAIALARQRGLELIGLEMDHEGILPDTLARMLVEVTVSGREPVLYVTPTLQNPTTATMSAGRRADIVRLCRSHDAMIVEDDVHAIFAKAGTVPLATLAPERTLHVSGLSKSLSPGLRIGSLLVPEALVEAAKAELRATCTMASLLSCSIMERWLCDGTARSVVDTVRHEVKRRADLAREMLPDAIGCGSEAGFHVWLPLARERAMALRSDAAARGIALPDPESFMADPCGPVCGMRLSLGGPDYPALTSALQTLAALLDDGGR